ncbi:MAG: endonuclease/exonuclease/phosphatase family protein, partial [Candidatus Limisoma sp.]|nr:endonuclease/exonuclease/phosphatase family protein [Candidatus Limisoma sp.]
DSASYLALMPMAYPLFLIATIPTLLFWVVKHRRLMLITVCSWLATIPQICAFMPIHFNDIEQAQSEKGSYTLTTYNTFGFAGDKETKNAIIDEILEKNADFVCIQEATTIEDLRYWQTDPDRIARLCARYPYVHFSDKNHTLGCFSKRPIGIIMEQSIGNYFYVEAYKTSGLGGEIYIINTHMESIGLTVDDKRLYMDLTQTAKKETLKGVRSHLLNKLLRADRQRAVQARLIKSIADSLRTASPHTPLFICGDFNDPPYTYSYLTAKGNYSDAYTDAGVGYAHTYNRNRFYFRIDNIFYDDRLVEAEACRVGTSKASDHHSVTATFNNHNK